MPRRLPIAGALLSISLALHASAEPREFGIGWLMVMDWDSDYPEAPECLVNHPEKPGGWVITYESVWLEDIVSGAESLAAYDLVVTTGHEGYAFAPPELAILEDYIDAGGILWFDDCGGLQIDNLPYGLEIDFANESGLYAGGWDQCFGNHFTVHEPDHPLVWNRFHITAADIRTDPGLNDSQWFLPTQYHDPAYDVVIEGHGQLYGYDGPAVLAHRHGKGKIVATALDMTCALECQQYNNHGIPSFDYYFVFNMLAWQDVDHDDIYDRDEGAFTDVDTDGDTHCDYLDYDADGDGIPDCEEAGDDDPDTPPVDTDQDTIPDFQDLESDGDGILDAKEHGVDVDGNGVGDPDVDGDGVPNYLDYDTDGDGKPDEVEGEGDDDGDGIPNFADEDDATPPGDDDDDDPVDGDGDGVPDAVDNCVDVSNPGQIDSDGDGTGNACDGAGDDGDDLFGDSCECRAGKGTRWGGQGSLLRVMVIGGAALVWRRRTGRRVP